MKFPRLASLGSALAGVSILTCSCSGAPVSQQSPPVTAQRNVLPKAPPAPAQVAAKPSVAPTPVAATTGASPSPSPVASPLAAASPGMSPIPTPTEIPPAIDITMTGPSVQISDAPLSNAITYSVAPARAASMRVVERARQQLVSGNADDAIRTLGQALSIDSSDPYAYFYLGRAYFVKGNQTQAVTFLNRAAVGFGSDRMWLSETYAFEGASYEAAGSSSEAATQYKKSLDLMANNRIALAGCGRMAAFATPAAQASPGAIPGAPDTGLIQPAGNGAAIPPPPLAPAPLPAPTGAPS
jgi:hypothetical protein